MTFGDILNSLLENTGLSQKQLAAELNLAPSTLGHYVRDEREPDYKTLKQIAEYFNVSTDLLLDCHTVKSETYSEAELLRVFRTLSPEHKRIYIEQGKAFGKK
ncbi:MAG: helix-turn-helix domain-containing protein [Oscillospiraceae bacterium]|jgi:transcriptional regulator with XRE-family HTH domain|nr:helix-turn-helix domain-containing protein [Oscillospiraceae bacterium]